MTSAAYAETVQDFTLTVSGTGSSQSVLPGAGTDHLHSADDTVGRNHISSGSDFFGFWCACRIHGNVQSALSGRG